MITEDLIIDVRTLTEWLESEKPVTVLDVRPKAEREEWHIPGSVHADVYDRLKAGDKTALDDIELDHNTPVVTVCGAGKTSVLAAEWLKEKGLDVYSLEGGMKAWNYAWNTATIAMGDVTIIQVRRSAKGCLSYVIGSGHEAVVIDASLDPEVYLQVAKANGWTIKYVTDTHIHADYLSRTRELARASMATHVLLDKAVVDYPYTPVKHGEYLFFGTATLEVIHTPGHTMESTTFRLGDEALFTGDTLFIDGVGRPDLKASPDEAITKSRLLYDSLHQLLNIAPTALVLPAHLATAVPFDDKLIAERMINLRDKLDVLKLSGDEFISYTTSRIPPTPPNYLTIANLNRQGSYDGYVPADLEAGANRCAIA